MLKKLNINKIEKLTCNLYNNERYIINLKLLKQVLYYALVLKEVHRVFEFNQEA